MDHGNVCVLAGPVRSGWSGLRLSAGRLAAEIPRHIKTGSTDKPGLLSTDGVIPVWPSTAKKLIRRVSSVSGNVGGGGGEM